MAFVLGVLAVAVALTLTIAVHEAGHVFAARRLGVAVPLVRVGYGPRILAFERGGTRVVVGALPLGGATHLHGVIPPGTRPHRRWMTRLRALATHSQGGAAPADDASALWPRPAWHKVLIAAAGPAASLALAVGLLFATTCGLGLPTSSVTVGALDDCVPTSTVPGSPCVRGSHGPAQAAGILPGDVVRSVAGTPVTSWDQVVAVVAASGPGSPVTLILERDGRELTVRVTPAEVAVPVRTDEGSIVTTPDGATVMMAEPFLGAAPAPEYRRLSVRQSAALAGALMRDAVSGVARLPVSVATSVTSAFNEQPRTVKDATSIVGVLDYAGQVADAEGTALTGGVKLRMLLALVVAMNVLLCVANLLPLPPLDGGNVAAATWEGARRRVAAWRGLDDPGPCDPVALLPLSLAVAGLLSLSGVALAVADVVDPVNFNG